MNHIERRIANLNDTIERNLSLLKEYEDALLFQSDPRERARYRHAVAELRADAEQYQAVYNQLRADLDSHSTGASKLVEVELEKVNHKLDLLLGSFDQLKALILSHYDAEQCNVVAPLIARLDEQEATQSALILAGIDQGRINGETQARALDEVQKALKALATIHRAPLDPQVAAQVQKVSQSLESTKLELASKLKLSVPVIPFLINYEVELSSKSGIDIRKLWNWLTPAHPVNDKLPG